MPGEIDRLTVAVGADTSALSAGFAGISPVIGKLAGLFTNIPVLIGASLAVAGVLIGKFAMDAQKDIGAGTRAIRTGTGDTGKALEQLKGSMINVGKTVPQSFAEVGKSIADLHEKLGLTGKPLEDMTRQIENLCRITGIDAPTMIGLASRAFSDWGISTKNQGSSLDFLFKVSQQTGIGVDSLAEKVTKFGAPLRGLGFDFQQSAVLIGQFEKAGVNTDQAMMSLKMGLGKLAKAGEEPKAALSRLVTEIKNAKTPAEATAKAIALVGAKGGVELADAIRKGTFSVDDMVASLQKSPETINKAANDTLKFSDRMKILGNNIKPILAPLGKGIFDALNLAAKGLIAAVHWVSEFIEKIKTGSGVFKTIREVISTVFNAIREVVSTVAKFISDFWKKYGDRIMKDTKVAFTYVWNIIKAYFNIIKAEIMIAVKIITALWDRFGKQMMQAIKIAFTFIWNIIKAAFNIIRGIFNIFKGIFTGDWHTFWNGIKQLFGGIWNAIAAVFKYVWDTIKNTAQAVWNAIAGIAKVIWEGIKLYFTTVWNIIKAVAETIWNNLKAFFTAWLTVTKAVFTTVWNAIMAVLTAIWNTISAVASAVWGAIKIVVTTVWDAVTGAWSAVWGAIKGAVEGVWNAIVGAWHAIVDPIISIAKSIWDGVAGAWSSAWDGIKRAVTAIWDAIKRAYDDTIGKLVGAAKWLFGSGGGGVPGHQAGGMQGPIPGTGVGDIVPAMLEPVVNKKAAGILGSRNMALINQGMLPGSSGGTSITVGDIHLHSVSPDYDAKRLRTLMNGYLREAYHGSRMEPRTIG